MIVTVTCYPHKIKSLESLYSCLRPGGDALYSTISASLFITRDDVVSQRLKFGSAFLSLSWESELPCYAG